MWVWSHIMPPPFLRRFPEHRVAVLETAKVLVENTKRLVSSAGNYNNIVTCTCVCVCVCSSTNVLLMVENMILELACEL